MQCKDKKGKFSFGWFLESYDIVNMPGFVWLCYDYSLKYPEAFFHPHSIILNKDMKGQDCIKEQIRD